MTTQNKLQFIREKCIEANPEKMWDDPGNCKRCWADDFSQTCSCPTEEQRKVPVRLADVFLALKENSHQVQFSKLGQKHYKDLQDVGWWMRFWNLKDDNLDHQSKETIDFIHGLLK